MALVLMLQDVEATATTDVGLTASVELEDVELKTSKVPQESPDVPQESPEDPQESPRDPQESSTAAENNGFQHHTTDVTASAEMVEIELDTPHASKDYSTAAEHKGYQRRTRNLYL